MLILFHKCLVTTEHFLNPYHNSNNDILLEHIKIHNDLVKLKKVKIPTKTERAVRRYFQIYNCLKKDLLRPCLEAWARNQAGHLIQSLALPIGIQSLAP